MVVTAQRVAVDVVAYGRAATEALAARIGAAKQAHPLDPVTVVVPSNAAGLSARRLLGSGALGGRGLANVAFVTPLRLAELLGASELRARRPLTNPVLAAAARAVLAEQPGMFRDVAGHEATQAAVVQLYGELSRAVPTTLAAIACSSARGAEAVRLVRAVRARLAAHHDEDDLAVAATHRLARDPGAAAALGTVVWHLPERQSPAMRDLLAQVLAAAPSSVVVGLTGADDADAAVRELCAHARLELPPSPPVEQPRAHRIISAADPDEEVRTVLREVMALAEAGTDLHRIGVFFPAADPYARTLLEQLAAAGIPHNGPATARLADSVAGRTLLAALALPAQGWGRGDVLALVSGAPVRTTRGHRVAAGRWDALTRAAGVVGGLEDWRRKLAAHLALLRAEQRRLAAQGGAGAARSEAVAADVAALEEVGELVEALAARLSALGAERSWAAFAAGARALLAALVGPEHLRVDWPEWEADAAARVESALDRLVVLDEIEPHPRWTSFEHAVRAELDASGGRTGRFGEGVLVAPLAAAAGLDLDAVLVVGMVEGTCPSFRRDDSLLPDDDRALATAAELSTRPQRLADQHRALLAALAAGRTSRILLLPRGDLRDRRGRLPSRWVLDDLTSRAGRKVFSSDVHDLAHHAVERVASYADGLGRARVHGSAADRDVAALLHHVAAGGDPVDHPLATGALGRGFTCHRSRESSAFTEWDGNLAGAALPSPATDGAAISPSRLETWAACPFRYFLGSVLGLGDRDDPEEILEIRAADRGSLVHEVLERFYREVIGRDGGPPAPDERWTAADRTRLRELAGEVFARYEAEGLTGRPLLWRRARADVLDDLDALLHRDDAHRAAEGARPLSVEMPFGAGGAPPLTLELADGRSLAFRGVADRVDAADGGRLVVLDYKTGKDHYKALADDPVMAGTTLQLGVYAEAARARHGADRVDARYWMASSRGGFTQRGYEWTDERRTRFLDVVGTIVDGIESGTFPGRPGGFDSFFGRHERCGHCDFDRVCPRNRDDHEQAKAAAPELSLLDRLRMPDDGDEQGADR